jgi:RHS repeat-associated protein
MYLIHADHLNTPRLISDENQATVWRWEQQEPFGASAANEDADNNGVVLDFPLRFPGQYFDKETGLHYNYFRDYDPAIGRYIESDPTGLAGGINTYAYVGGNPLTRIDRFGLEPVGTIPTDPEKAAVFYNWPSRMRKPTGGCVVDCILKRQAACLPMRGLGALGGVVVAAVGSFPSGGADFGILVGPSVAIGSNWGAGVCAAYFFERSCQQECSPNSCVPN